MLVTAAEVFVENSEVAAVFVAESAESRNFGGVEVGGTNVDSFGK